MILFYILLKVAWTLMVAVGWLMFWMAAGTLFLVWMLVSLPFRFLRGLTA